MGGVGWAPVPIKLIDWGLPLALSTILTLALRVPVVVGVNFTLIEQLPPAARLLPQVYVFEKSPGFVPVRPMLVMLRLPVPVLVNVTLCAALVAPVFTELKLRVAAERLTAGTAVGPGVPPPPPPPPQAAQTPTTRREVANTKAAGRRRSAEEVRSTPRASDPAKNQSNPTGNRKLGGIFRCSIGRVLLAPVVAMVSASVTAEALLRVTDGDVNVQVAPVGQPLATLRLTLPVNPFCGVTLIVEVPCCPGAEMVTGDGFADRPKSPTVTEFLGDVEAA